MHADQSMQTQTINSNTQPQPLPPPSRSNAQAQEVLRGTGSLSPERQAYLEDMRKQLSLPQEKADKIIREVGDLDLDPGCGLAERAEGCCCDQLHEDSTSTPTPLRPPPHLPPTHPLTLQPPTPKRRPQQIRTEVMGASAALEGTGGQKWTVERVVEAHKEGIDVKKALEDPSRRMLLRRELDKRLGDGKGNFDAKLLLDELPKILGIDQRRIDALLRELVGSRKRMLLVQAVSQHRQKRRDDAVTSLNNLISVYRAVPEKEGVGAVQWGEREELKELLGTYCLKVRLHGGLWRGCRMHGDFFCMRGFLHGGCFFMEGFCSWRFCMGPHAFRSASKRPTKAPQQPKRPRSPSKQKITTGGRRRQAQRAGFAVWAN